ncbi:MAG: diguanylate cyclase, partial [Candidatus Eremiobacteraeota bacterium]|nr:diguanylate cyclase [Candidatus Eremiobacteraeota bacterium]
MDFGLGKYFASSERASGRGARLANREGYLMFGPPFGLEQVFTHLPVSVWTTDGDLRITYVADPARALGLREGDVVGQTAINSVLDNRTNPAILDAFARAKRGERASFRTKYREHWYHARIEPLRDETDRIVGTVGAALDVTADTPRASGYRATDSALAVAQRLAGVGSWRLDYVTREVTVTPEYEAMTGRSFPNPTTFDAVFDTIYAEDRAPFLSAFEESRSTRMPYDIQHRIVREDGALRDVRARGTFAFDGDDPKSVVGTILDITDQMALDRVLSQMTYHDSLTGLPNEALLRDRLTRAISRAQRSNSMVALLAVEADRFGDINDTLGLAVADQFLLEISKRLGEVMRPSDTVARRGGNEFIVILPDIREPSQVSSVLRRLRTSLRKPLLTEGREMLVTVSVGIAIFPSDGHETETLLRCGISAMHRSQEDAPDGFRYYSDTMHNAVVNRLQLDQRLRVAIEERRMDVGYQPMIDIVSGKLWGFEALLRWPGTDESAIEPKTFIPLAEDNGLIAALGEHVLRTALDDMMALAEKTGLPVRIGINVSPRQFVDPGFPAVLKNIIIASKMDPSLLELEITESALIKNMEVTASNLR